MLCWKKRSSCLRTGADLEWTRRKSHCVWTLSLRKLRCASVRMRIMGKAIYGKKARCEQCFGDGTIVSSMYWLALMKTISVTPCILCSMTERHLEKDLTKASLIGVTISVQMFWLWAGSSQLHSWTASTSLLADHSHFGAFSFGLGWVLPMNGK